LADDFNQSVTYPFTNVYILQCNMHTFYQFMFSMVTKPVNLMIENIEPYGKKKHRTLNKHIAFFDINMHLSFLQSPN